MMRAVYFSPDAVIIPPDTANLPVNAVIVPSLKRIMRFT